MADLGAFPYRGEEFAQILDAHVSEWGPSVSGMSVRDAKERLIRYRALVCEENENQNLTRILEPFDFYHGHIADVSALHKSGLCGKRNFDLGSGAGVPGLVSACLNQENEWLLGESEGMKAEFLARATRALGLSNVRVLVGRAEDTLPSQADIRVISRAVGPVLRIFNWIEKCSTWNTLVLFKGPSWDEEWLAFQQTPKKNRLVISQVYDYTIHARESKSRRLVELVRK
jgi:16S rRNA (guanine527-N7)-methyltransferase